MSNIQVHPADEKNSKANESEEKKQIYPDIPQQQQPGFVNQQQQQYQQQPGYVTQQPYTGYTPTNQTIVIGGLNSEPAKPKIREWTSGLCDCCSNLGGCACAYFFPWCYLCTLYSKAGEGCCSCIYGGVSHLRTKVRSERGIRGTICEDVCLSYFCTCCVMVQIDTEISTTDSAFAKN